MGPIIVDLGWLLGFVEPMNSTTKGKRGRKALGKVVWKRRVDPALVPALESVLKGGKAEPSFTITHVPPMALNGKETTFTGQFAKQVEIDRTLANEILEKYPVQTVNGEMKWYVPQQELDEVKKLNKALFEDIGKLDGENSMLRKQVEALTLLTQEYKERIGAETELDRIMSDNAKMKKRIIALESMYAS